MLKPQISIHTDGYPFTKFEEGKDLRKAECPNCCTKLKKVPVRKTKCPDCKQYMYVRTRPDDNTRVVVAEEEAKEIDLKNDLIYKERSLEEAGYEIETEKEKLRKRFNGKEPSINDVCWSIYNKELIKHSQNADWGLYRNTKFDIAELLYEDGKKSEALKTILEVCYIDLNGPNNCSGLEDSGVLSKVPWFEPEKMSPKDMLAPGLIETIILWSKELKVNKKDIETIFINHCTNLMEKLNLPLEPKLCWKPILEEINNHSA